MSEKSSNKSLTSIFHMRGLYDQAMTSIKTLDELRLRKRIIDENEFRNYPFKPSLNKNKSSYSLGKIVKKESANQSMEKYINCCNENTKLYERSFKWKEANEAKYKQIRTEKEKNKFVDCSFTPKLTSMNNSFTFSKSKSTNFINQANIEYANKRQNYLKKKKNEEEIVNKKKFPNGADYVMKQTTVKQFEFGKTNSRKKTNVPKYAHSTSSVNVHRAKFQTKKNFL